MARKYYMFGPCSCCEGDDDIIITDPENPHYNPWIGEPLNPALGFEWFQYFPEDIATREDVIGGRKFGRMPRPELINLVAEENYWGSDGFTNGAGFFRLQTFHAPQGLNGQLIEIRVHVHWGNPFSVKYAPTFPFRNFFSRQVARTGFSVQSYLGYTLTWGPYSPFTPGYEHGYPFVPVSGDPVPFAFAPEFDFSQPEITDNVPPPGQSTKYPYASNYTFISRNVVDRDIANGNRLFHLFFDPDSLGFYDTLIPGGSSIRVQFRMPQP